MTLTVWRNVLHKFIVVIGFMALIAIMTAANVSGSTERLTLAEDFFKRQNQTPAPLLVSQCEKKSWLDDILLGPDRKGEKACTITIKEGHDEHSKRFTYVQR